MSRKKQKIKEEANKVIRDIVPQVLGFGLPLDTFISESKKLSPHATEEQLAQIYNEKRAMYALTPEQSTYSEGVKEIVKSNPNSKFTLCYPIFDIVDYMQVNDVGVLWCKAKNDTTLYFKDRGEETTRKYIRGENCALVTSSLLNTGELMILNETDKQVITRYTHVIEKEVIKVVTETKVVTQEKKVDIDPKKIEKAKKKIMHKYKNSRWEAEAHLLFEEIIQELKN